MEKTSQGNYRKRIITVITFLGGLYFFLEFVLPSRVLEAVGAAPYHEQISKGFITVGSMALGLGLINLFLIHGSRVVFQKKGWLNSLALLTGLLLMMFLSTFDWLGGLQSGKAAEDIRLLAQFAGQIKKDYEAGRTDVPPLDFRLQKLREALQERLAEADKRCRETPANRPISLLKKCEELQGLHLRLDGLREGKFEKLEELSELLSAISVSRGKLENELRKDTLTVRLFNLLREGFFVSLGSAMFSLLGFYIAAAAYRAFRIRSYESALMMCAALIVMFGQMSFALRLYDGFGLWRSWLMNIPNSAAFRAIRIGAAVAGLVLAFRMWFSIESESFTEKK